MDNFADAPRTIGELKSDKTQSACDWKPRDALIWLLREIDSGKIDADHLIMCWREKIPEGTNTKYKQAGGSPWAWDALGLLARVSHMINNA